MTATPLQDDEARRRAATDIATSFLVEAGAGTGKTSVLVQRILTILRSGQGQLDRLAAITFTDKAAAELRARLHFEIETALASRLTDSERQNLREARRQFDRAQISTVHAFCANLLRERPVEAVVDPDFSVLDAFAASILRQEVWREWLASEMDKSPFALKHALRAGVTLAHLESLRDFLLEYRDSLSFLPAPVEDRLAEFAQLFQRHVASLKECARACVNTNDRALKQIVALSELLADSEEGHLWEKVLLSALPCSPKAGTKAHWKPSRELDEARRLFQELGESWTQTRAAWTHNLTIALVVWLQGYLAVFEEKKRERGSLDFVDLLLLTRDLLKRDLLVRRYFQRRFHFLLVDEFQDTDPLQAEIIFFLAEQESRATDWAAVTLQPGKLFLVGDPQQSIYRFRRADLLVYTQVREAILRQGEILSLATNFRTRAPALTWINQTFAREFAAVEGEQSAYRPLLEARTEKTGREVVVVPVPAVSEKPNREVRRQAEARAMAVFLANAVGEAGVDMWGGQSIAYRDVAILCRTHQTLEAYEDALRDAGIPHHVIGGRRYVNRQEIEEIRALLRAIESPSDTEALVATLRSSLFGCSDEELAAFVSGGGQFDYTRSYLTEGHSPLVERFAAMFTLLRELHARRTQLSPAALLTELYARTHILPLFALLPQGHQRVANLLKLVETARSLAAQGLVTVSALNRFLAFQEMTGGDGDVSFPDESSSAVRLLTIHQAKGLEFPVVILADAAYSQRRASRSGIIDRRSGKLELRVGPRDLTWSTLGWQNAEAQEQAREAAEERRLWYVAATRVRDHLVIPLTLSTEGERTTVEHWAMSPELSSRLTVASRDQEPDDDAFGVWFYRFRASELTPEVTSSSFLPPFVQVQLSKAATHDYKVWEEARRVVLATGKQAAPFFSVTALATEAKQQPEGAEKATVRGGDQLTRLRFGRAVHAALRRVNRLNEAQSSLRGLLGSEPFKERAEVERLVANALLSPVMLRARKAEERFAETPIALHVDGRLLEGVIDLAFLENEAWVIVDFKTDQVVKDLVSTRTDAYRAQLSLYALALERLTRYPVKELVLLFVRSPQEIIFPWGEDERRLAGALVSLTSAGYEGSE